MRVIALDNLHRPWGTNGMVFPYFTVGKMYVVLGICADSVRLLADNNHPVLLPQERVGVVDPVIPACFLRFEDRTAPGMFLVPGFFERWHDGDERFRRLFELQYAQLAADDAERNGPLSL